MPRSLKVVNLFAGPGAGKSTLAAGLFNLMKSRDHHVELVTEFAKDLTYEKNMAALENQFLVAAQQDHRVRRLVGQVEWVITDSPIPMGLCYMARPEFDFLEATLWGAFHRYDNRNVFVKRGDRRYQAYGRNQNHEEAKELDLAVKTVWEEARVWDPYKSCEVASTVEAPYRVYEWLINDHRPD